VRTSVVIVGPLAVFLDTTINEIVSMGDFSVINLVTRK